MSRITILDYVTGRPKEVEWTDPNPPTEQDIKNLSTPDIPTPKPTQVSIPRSSLLGPEEVDIPSLREQPSVPAPVTSPSRGSLIAPPRMPIRSRVPPPGTPTPLPNAIAEVADKAFGTYLMPDPWESYAKANLIPEDKAAAMKKEGIENNPSLAYTTAIMDKVVRPLTSPGMIAAAILTEGASEFAPGLTKAALAGGIGLPAIAEIPHTAKSMWDKGINPDDTADLINELLMGSAAIPGAHAVGKKMFGERIPEPARVSKGPGIPGRIGLEARTPQDLFGQPKPFVPEAPVDMAGVRKTADGSLAVPKNRTDIITHLESLGAKPMMTVGDEILFTDITQTPTKYTPGAALLEGNVKPEVPAPSKTSPLKGLLASPAINRALEGARSETKTVLQRPIMPRPPALERPIVERPADISAPEIPEFRSRETEPITSFGEPEVAFSREKAPKSKFEIYDTKTGQIKGRATTREGAVRSVDRNDNIYGGYRHSFREVTPEGIKERFGTLKPFDKAPEPEINFAREGGKVKIGVNVQRSADELTKGYNRPLPEIMTREGLQNAIDIVRPLGSKGDIHISTGTKSLTIKDNGRGMSPQELETVYTNLHETGKVGDAGAAGGKGVGKAPYMLGGEHFRVETVKEINGKKIKSVLEGTPAELMEGVEPVTIEVHKDTPTGTKFTTKLKDDQDSYYLRAMLTKMLKHSRDIPSNIHVDEMDLGQFSKKNFKSRADDNVIAKTTSKNGKNEIEILIPKDAQLGSRSHMEGHFLNKGMYQFSKYHYLGEETNGIPKEFIVDISPLAEEGSADYPFPVQRESIKADLEKEIENLVNKALVEPLSGRKKIDLQKLWDALPVVTKAGVRGNTRDIIFFDPGNRLTPEELKKMVDSPVIKKLGSLFDSTIRDVLDASGNREWSKKLDRVGFMLSPDNPDGTVTHGIHIPHPLLEKSAILINPFDHALSREPGDAALDIVTTILHEVAHIGKENPTYLKEFTDADLADPRVGKYLRTFMKQVQTQGGLDAGHGFSFIHRLGNIYVDYGVKRGLDAATRIRETIADPIIRQNRPEFSELLRIYSEAKGRDATTEDILSGTGVKQSDKGRDGEGGIPGDNKADGDGAAGKKRGTPGDRERVAKRREKTRQLIVESIKEVIPLQKEQVEINTKERKERLAGFQRSFDKSDDWQGAMKALGETAGKFEKVEYEPPTLKPEHLDEIARAIKDANLYGYEQVNALYSIKRMFGLTDEPAVPRRSELDILEKIWPDISKDLDDAGYFRPGPLVQGAFDAPAKILANTINIPKSFMSTLDFSGVFRQGLGLVHTREFRQAIPDMFKAFASEKGYDAIQHGLTRNPWYTMGERYGLSLTDLGELDKREEAFVSNVADKFFGLPAKAGQKIKDVKGDPLSTNKNAKLYDKVPDSIANALSKFPNPARATNRAYTAFLNKMRVETFARLLEDAEFFQGENVTDPKAPKFIGKELANYVNTATGRGSLGDFNKISGKMNAAFFSPRLVASRLKMLNPGTYLNPSGNNFIRKQYAKSALGMMSFGGTILGLGLAAGGNVELDPTSSDFMKLRFGNTRLDPWAGHQQYLVALARVMMNVSKTIEGRTYELGGKYGSPTRKDIVERFAQGKLSPAFSFLAKLAEGKDYKGNPVDVKAEMISRGMPLLISDLYDLYQEEPDLYKAAMSTFGATFGMGLQTFNDKKSLPEELSGMLPNYTDYPLPRIPGFAPKEKESPFRSPIGGSTFKKSLFDKK